MAVTSTFPEAFGMVAAEAAACGALPVVAATPAWARSPARSPAAVPEPARGWLTFEVGPGAVARARRRRSPAGSPPPRTSARRTREAIVEATRERYSWDGVARTVIAAAQGELDDLPRALSARAVRHRSG